MMEKVESSDEDDETGRIGETFILRTARVESFLTRS